MELIRGLHNLRPRHRGCVATVGAFDGVHRGHQTLLRELTQQGAGLGLASVVICFEPLPREFFAPHSSPARLMNFREKFTALKGLGIDRLLRIGFDERFRAVSAEDFIQRVFVQGLGVRYVVAGDDLRFGAGRGGDIDVLRAAGTVHGFDVADTPSVLVDGQRVSSSRIRRALERGDFGQAERLLGRPYTMSGKVMLGRQLGRTLGVPTANLELHRTRAPMAGVYAVEVAGFDGQGYQGVANVGLRPTVGDRSKALLEVHIFDFDGHLYGRHIDVMFRHKIRDERKFDSLDELKRWIAADIQASRAWFAGC